MILSHALILHVSQLQTQQLMTSQLSSHIKYLTQTCIILVFNLYSKMMKKCSVIDSFKYDLMMILARSLFWATLQCLHTSKAGVLYMDHMKSSYHYSVYDLNILTLTAILTSQ